MPFKRSTGIFISKRTLVMFLIFVVCVCVAIGLLAGLIREGCPSDVTMSEPASSFVTSQNTATMPTVETFTRAPCRDVWCNMRLPNYLIPLHYNLTQFPHFEHNESSFDGNVSVSIRLNQDSQYLLTHINFLEILHTRVMDATGKNLKVKRTFEYKPNDFFIVEMDKEISSGTTVFLQIQFHGSFYGLVGYYKSTYIDSRTGQKRYLATTKFQPTDARLAFPCLDEPGLKATFTVTLIHKMRFIPLSNMPVARNVTRSDGLVETTFLKSPPMPTYLVAFIVCDFEFIEGHTNNGLPVRIYGRPDRIHEAEFALEAAIETTEWFNQWTNMTYQLPKLDHVNIPDYPTGATEHWGVITYGRGRLFLNTTTPLTGQLQDLARVITHESAHNYFGNTFTCNWWEDIWLNEGFASYFEHKAMGDMALYNDWNMTEQIVPKIQEMLYFDSMIPSSPVIMPVQKTYEIRWTFNKFMYRKGRAVVNMINAVMGDDRFQEGIQRLLEKYEFKSLTTDQLWTELETVMAPGFDFKELFDPWVHQTGYPLLEVHQIHDTIKVSQSQFLQDVNATVDKDDSKWGYRWPVPILWVTSRNKSGSPWLKWNIDGESEFVINPFDPVNDVIKLNKGNRGFYRVNYSKDMWNKLVVKLVDNPDTFGSGDRANLIDDAFEIAMASRLGIEIGLNLTRYMLQESSFAPWKALRNKIDFITTMFYHHPLYFCLRKHFQQITKPSMMQLTFKDVGTHIEKLNREDVIAIACEFGEQHCLNGATSHFLDSLNSNGTLELPPNLKRHILKYGMQQAGGTKAWNFLWSRIIKADFKKLTYFYERRKPWRESLREWNSLWDKAIESEFNELHIISETRRPWFLNQLIHNAMDETKIPSTHFFNVFSLIANNPVGSLVLWDWYRLNWNKLKAKFDIENLQTMWPTFTLARNFNTDVRLREVQVFFEDFPQAASKDEQRELVRDIEKNIAWMKKNEKALQDWLVAYAC